MLLRELSFIKPLCFSSLTKSFLINRDIVAGNRVELFSPLSIDAVLTLFLLRTGFSHVVVPVFAW